MTGVWTTTTPQESSGSSFVEVVILKTGGKVKFENKINYLYYKIKERNEDRLLSQHNSRQREWLGSW